MKTNEIKPLQTMDFVKEFCNLASGFLKRNFEKHGMIIGCSLPMVTRGYYQVFQDEKASIYLNNLHHCFTLEHPHFIFHIEAHCQILHPSALKIIDGIEDIKELESEDEIEFL